MEIYEIKATLSRSNPLLLRQFTMDADRKLKELGQILQTLLGWKEMWPCSFMDGRNTILPETTLRTAFAARSGFTCVLTSKGKPERTWEFRLKLVGKAAQGEWPRVVRSRSDNLPQDTTSGALLNLLLQNWDGTARSYFNTFCNTHSRQDYLFSAAQANRILKRRFRALDPAPADSAVLELDYKKAADLADKLAQVTVAELRDIARRLDITFPTGVRKEVLVKYLAQEMGKAKAVNCVLDYLTLGQYRAFRRICCGDGKMNEPGAMEETIHTLVVFSYAGVDYFSFASGSDKVYNTRQLLEAYEEWLDTVDEPQYLRLALLRSTILACTRLYGCLKKKTWKQIVPRIAEKKRYTDEEMETAWEKVWFHLSFTNITPGDLDFLYCTDVMDRDGAKKLAGLQSRLQLYAPKLTEIRQLEAGGFLYPDPKGAQLERFLQTEYNMQKSQAHEIHYQIYRSLQFGSDPNAYADWLLPHLSSDRRKGSAALKMLFGELAPMTRQMVYGGHTKTEMERMR